MSDLSYMLSKLDVYTANIDAEDYEYALRCGRLIHALIEDVERLSAKKSTLDKALTTSKILAYCVGIIQENADIDVFCTAEMYRYAIENLSPDSASYLNWFHNNLLETSLFEASDIEMYMLVTEK